jgi:transcriptional regulator with GAF, ATPase, and Fis domain
VLGFLREFDHTAGRGLDITSEAMDALLRPRLARQRPRAAQRPRAGDHLCEDGSIRPKDLSLWPTSPAQVDSTELEVIERHTIERVMREANGNKVQASRRLGITRMQLYSRLRKYGLDAPGAPAVEGLVADGAHVL